MKGDITPRRRAAILTSRDPVLFGNNIPTYKQIATRLCVSEAAVRAVEKRAVKGAFQKMNPENSDAHTELPSSVGKIRPTSDIGLVNLLDREVLDSKPRRGAPRKLTDEKRKFVAASVE